MLSRHADCVRVLHHPETSNDQRNSALFKAYTEATGFDPFEDRQPSFLFLDPPDHTRLRALVHLAFTPRLVERMRARIESLSEELLSRALAAGRIDLIADGIRHELNALAG